jgi:dTDP-glucose 4,6-dehydratase
MHKGADGGIYNISGTEMTNLGIIKGICAVLGKNHKKHLNNIADRPGGDKRYAVDASKVKTELGWDLRLPIRNSLASVVDWYLDNTDWWKKVKKKKEFTVYYEKNLRSEY